MSPTGSELSFSGGDELGELEACSLEEGTGVKDTNDSMELGISICVRIWCLKNNSDGVNPVVEL